MYPGSEELSPSVLAGDGVGWGLPPAPREAEPAAARLPWGPLALWHRCSLPRALKKFRKSVDEYRLLYVCDTGWVYFSSLLA